MVLISRIPVIAISSVRGIGVADRARTSTAVRSRFSCSLCSTPNRCSSSMITSPRSLKATSFDNSRWVPTTTSTRPSARPSIVARASVSDWNRLSGATLIGKPAYRSAKVAWCCCTSSVVGTRIATCLPSITALNAARTAISVLP